MMVQKKKMTIEKGPESPEPHIPEAKKKLDNRWLETMVCLGLDSEYSRLPEAVRLSFRGDKLEYDLPKHSAMSTFNKKDIDQTRDLVCAYKLNFAFYGRERRDGITALEISTDYIRKKSPESLLILDAKMADIGNTNRGYSEMAFEWFGADAVTVAPYMGSSLIKDGERKLESLAPFLEQKDKLIFVLCRTSNEDAGEFQDLPIALDKLTPEYKAKFGDLNDLAEKIDSNSAPLYLVLAHKLKRDWDINRNVGLVVGATYPEELKLIRRVVGDMPILTPGVGAQNGTPEEAIKAGMDSHNQGLIVNSSRALIFASGGDDFAEATRRETQKLKDQINQFRRAA